MLRWGVTKKQVNKRRAEGKLQVDKLESCLDLAAVKASLGDGGYVVNMHRVNIKKSVADSHAFSFCTDFVTVCVSESRVTKKTRTRFQMNLDLLQPQQMFSSVWCVRVCVADI